MTRPPKNIAASVRAKLAHLSERTGEDYNVLLVRYALERLLFRLAESDHGSSFVLKGAMLFLVWGGHPHRATRDIDLLGFGEATTGRLTTVFRSLCVLAVEPDGVQFIEESVAAEEIRTIDEYGGIRVTLRAKIGSANIPIQVDIGFGDVMFPPAVTVEYPTILGMPAPKLRVYAKETVIAEKVEAMVKLGMLNSRFKDYFDLYILAKEYSFDGEQLQEAMRATFERRGTVVPAATPAGLTSQFSDDTVKQRQWRAFCKKTRVPDPDLSLAQAVESVAQFVCSPLAAVGTAHRFGKTWPPGGPWQ